MTSKTLRSLFAFVLALVLAAGMFAAAQPTQAQEDVTIAPQACEEPGNLRMWVWDENWAKVIEQSIEDWKANYCPGAEVTLEVQPWGQYWDLLRTGGSDLPDVFNMSQTYFYFYASNGVLLNLQPYWDAAGVDTTTWGTGLVDPYRWGEDQDLYAGPVNWDTVAVYYNKDLFDAAGVAYPTAEWTWDDFAAAAETLTDPENDVYGALAYVEFQAGYPNWIAATGTTPIVEAGRARCTLEDPGSLEALNYLKGLYDAGYMPSVSIVGGSNADDAFNFFASGKVAMVTGGSWKLPAAEESLTFNWDVVQLPRNPETGRSRSILHAVGYVASANTPNPDLAANLILYLVSDEGQTFFAEAGGVAPANPNPALQEMWMGSFAEGHNVQAFVDATVDSQGVTVFDEIWDKINTELVVKIFDQNVPVEEAVAEACEFINTQLPEKAE
ncbi:MAG: sugar ABC transporter substrate-binding protein [Anaerolineae bacterium]|nr:sugar ABC transporter substrate-binding protein [Anaerolineae bacterium]